ncbi:NAD(P)-dependent oxidoreductase [Kocuria sp. TGY1127_2]|uniref:NAD(P)-dependent oxidoreductase n=1 Tax=Kocuria sp. TGY1127_2 TaxID=2711328 RepID=UPI0015BEE3FC|nr:NAD(P)-dependent oxidoreductase [Kocuria sp. TGY1127_2]
MNQKSSIGWIGLGAMGAPMATVAARAGHAVTAFDLNPAVLESVAPLVDTASSAREAAMGADVVVIMVATGPQLDAVLFGEDGIADVLSSGTTLLIMSTVGLAAVQRAARALEPLTQHIVDAPVSGGVARAGTGDLLIMVGGSDKDVASVKPLLDALGSNCPVVGPEPGDGQKFKVVNQLLCGVHIAAAGEALALADSMGLDVAQCHEVLNGGAAQSFMFQDRGSRMVNEEFDEARSALNIFVKDMGLVTDAARAADQPVPLASAAEQVYLRGRREGLGRKDDSVVYQMLRERDR